MRKNQTRSITFVKVHKKKIKDKQQKRIEIIRKHVHTWSPAPISSSARFICTPAAISGDCWSNANKTLHVL